MPPNGLLDIRVGDLPPLPFKGYDFATSGDRDILAGFLRRICAVAIEREELHSPVAAGERVRGVEVALIWHSRQTALEAGIALGLVDKSQVSVIPGADIKCCCYPSCCWPSKKLEAPKEGLFDKFDDRRKV
jgi:hypothetical protein